MSSKSKHKRQSNSWSPKPPPSKFSASPQTSIDSGDKRDWTQFVAYNALPAPMRAAALPSLSILVTDPDVLGILTKSHFVIPGQTHFECQQCGECCRYARKVAQLTYEPCLFLTEDNLCQKHDSRYSVCKWFPFWVYNDPMRGPLLTIKPYCTGYGHGELVDYDATLRHIQQLAISDARDNDGAFVIHEVLMIPGQKNWVFPSKHNIDTLIRHIRRNMQVAEASQAPEPPVGSATEVFYAHHYTSGLLGSINAPLLTINEQGMMTDANTAACKLLSIDLDHLVGEPFAPFFSNPDRVAASIASCFAHGRETASPQRIIMPDGVSVPILLDGLTFRDRSDGLVHGIIVCLNPVSHTVYADVNQSRNYARGLLEASLDALMVIDRDGTITDVNEAVVILTGLQRSLLLGSPFQNLFVDSAKARDGVAATFSQGKVQNYELTMTNLQGEQIPVSFNATLYSDSEGVVQGIFAAARDIRDRLRMVHDLEEAKSYARGLIECSLDLMVTIDRGGIIRDANQAASRLTGRSTEMIIGVPFDTFFDDPTRARDGVELTFQDGEVRNYLMNLVTPGNRTVAVSFNATLYRDSSDKVQGVFAIARTC